MDAEKPETEFSAFISHSKRDFEFADELRAGLEERGLACWIAPRNVRLGKEYPEEIYRGINRSRCLILLLSSAANESPSVRREVELAVKASKPILPVRIEDVLPSPKLEFLVSITQWIDIWEGQLARHVETLAGAIEAGHDYVSPEFTPTKARLKRRRRNIAFTAVGILIPLVLSLMAVRQILFIREVDQIGNEVYESLSGEDFENALRASTEGLAESIRDINEATRSAYSRGLSTSQPNADTAREYLSHPGLEDFVNLARADLGAYRQEQSTNDRCRLPIEMSGVRPTIVAAIWPTHQSIGLRPGDLLLRVDGESIGDGRSDYLRALERHAVGDPVLIEFDRSNSEARQTVTCVARPPAEDARQRMLETAASRDWETCLKAAITVTAWFGNQTSTAWYQANCARYGGFIGQAQWQEQMFRYYSLLITEGTLAGLSALEAVGRMIFAEDGSITADVGRNARTLGTTYQTALSRVTRP